MSILLMILSMVSFTNQTTSEQIITRLENPNDDLVNLDTEIQELFSDLSGGLSKIEGEGLEFSISEFFIHDFGTELSNSKSLEEQVNDYLNNVKNLLGSSSEEQKKILNDLTLIYKRYIASEVLVDGRTKIPNEIELIVSAVSNRI